VEVEEEEEEVAEAEEVLDSSPTPLSWEHPRGRDSPSKPNATVGRRRPTNPRVPITIARRERPSSAARE